MWSSEVCVPDYMTKMHMKKQIKIRNIFYIKINEEILDHKLVNWFSLHVWCDGQWKPQHLKCLISVKLRLAQHQKIVGFLSSHRMKEQVTEMVGSHTEILESFNILLSSKQWQRRSRRFTRLQIAEWELKLTVKSNCVKAWTLLSQTETNKQEKLLNSDLIETNVRPSCLTSIDKHHCTEL